MLIKQPYGKGYEQKKKCLNLSMYRPNNFYRCFILGLLSGFKAYKHSYEKVRVLAVLHAIFWSTEVQGEIPVLHPVLCGGGYGIGWLQTELLY